MFRIDKTLRDAELPVARSQAELIRTLIGVVTCLASLGSLAILIVTRL